MCDDASTDDAYDRLSNIHDERFRYVRNDKNLGAHKNWLKSLELGLGEWLYFVIGRDRVHGEHIGDLIDILDCAGENNITFMIDGSGSEGRLSVYDGIEAMKLFIGYWHPTGMIFDSKTFHEIPDRKNYFSISDMYPENYIKRDMLMKGSGALAKSCVYTPPEPIIDKVKIKSTVENGKDLYSMYYAPARRTKQFLEMIDMIMLDEQEKFSYEDINGYFRIKFDGIIHDVSYGWKGACSNFEWQAHYGQEVREIGRTEMLMNIFRAYSDTKAHLQEKGLYTLKRQVIMFWCIVKIPAKYILKPLGIWYILKSAKKFLSR